jgi:dTDP-4-amino-4,6-dideoxygalactose transaminase
VKVPFVDLKAGIAAHRDEYLERITAVVDSAYFAGGPVVAELEQAFAEYCGAAHSVSVATGTDALILALRALDVGPGDEVITAPNSFFATAEAISLVGATPVFADVHDDTLLIDAQQIAAKITDRTKVIAPVHLFGQIADMEAIEKVAAERGIAIMEDSAQAHGAVRNGRRAGSMGAVAGFSFYPAKNMGAFGEGGAITTGSEDIANRCRRLRDHGQDGKHNHTEIGYNARLAAIQCAALVVRLRYMNDATAGRRAAAAAYTERLADVDGVRLVTEDAAGEAVYHLYVVRVDAARRDAVRDALGADGVSTGIHYPIPIHLQPAYASLGHKVGDFPVAEAAGREMISLPMYPELSTEAVEHVVASLRRALA